MAYIFDLVDTWASGGGPYTSIKMNATDNDSGSASLLMDLQVGTVSKFKVSKTGTVTTPGSIVADVDIYWTRDLYGLAATSKITFNGDAIISRRAAANLRLGAADAASGVQAQTLSVQSITGTNVSAAAYPFKITGAQGTGTGAGGSIIFQVAPAGGAGAAQNTPVDALTINSAQQALFSAGTASAPSLAFAARTTQGFYDGGGYIVVALGGQKSAIFGTIQGATTGAVAVPSGGGFAFSSTSDADGTLDTYLRRDAANTLALRNGTNAQTFRMYSTYTSDTDYSRLSIFDVSGDTAWYIKPQNLTSGAARSIVIGSSDAGGTSVYFQTAGSIRWRVDSAGHFLANADNLYAIGASGATRPRNLYVANQSTLTGLVQSGSQFRSTGSSSGMFVGYKDATPSFAMSVGLSRPGDAIGNDLVMATFNGTTWTTGLVVQSAIPISLSFGGTTPSFPALKRSSTTLQARLADDSAFAPVQGKLTTDTAYTAGTIVATGYLTLYDSTGTAYRVPCVV